MNTVRGGLQISNIPKLSFSWAQGATKTEAYTIAHLYFIFPTTKMMIWLPWTHGFSQCMKNIFLHWRNALCLRWDIHVKLYIMCHWTLVKTNTIFCCICLPTNLYEWWLCVFIRFWWWCTLDYYFTRIAP